MTGVIVKAPGPSGFGTQLFDAESGGEIKGITRIGINIVPDDIIRVEAEMFAASIEAKGELTLYVTDPSTGETKEPARIEFKDGTVWTA